MVSHRVVEGTKSSLEVCVSARAATAKSKRFMSSSLAVVLVVSMFLIMVHAGDSQVPNEPEATPEDYFSILCH